MWTTPRSPISHMVEMTKMQRVIIASCERPFPCGSSEQKISKMFLPDCGLLLLTAATSAAACRCCYPPPALWAGHEQKLRRQRAGFVSFTVQPSRRQLPLQILYKCLRMAVDPSRQHQRPDVRPKPQCHDLPLGRVVLSRNPDPYPLHSSRSNDRTLSLASGMRQRCTIQVLPPPNQQLLS